MDRTNLLLGLFLMVLLLVLYFFPSQRQPLQQAAIKVFLISLFVNFPLHLDMPPLHVYISPHILMLPPVHCDFSLASKFHEALQCSSC